MERGAEDVLAQDFVPENAENSTIWAVISGATQETVSTQIQNLEDIVPSFDFHSGRLNAIRPRFFMALSIFDVGNLKNTCLEAEPEVIILAYPYHEIPVDKSRNIWIHEWMLAKSTKKVSLEGILEDSSQNK